MTKFRLNVGMAFQKAVIEILKKVSGQQTPPEAFFHVGVLLGHTTGTLYTVGKIAGRIDYEMVSVKGEISFIDERVGG